MRTIDLEKRAHSADVQMHLSVSGHLLAISHLGPDYVILGDSIDHPPIDAEICMTVDGKTSRWRVKLVEGLSHSQARSRIAAAG